MDDDMATKISIGCLKKARFAGGGSENICDAAADFLPDFLVIKVCLSLDKISDISILVCPRWN